MAETFLLTRRSRRFLDRIRGDEPTKAEAAALATGGPAVFYAVEIPTCGGTFRLAGRAAYHVSLSTRLTEALSLFWAVLDVSTAQQRAFSGAVFHLASLDKQANAALAAALQETVKACSKAKAGKCACGARFAPIPTALADPDTAMGALGAPIGVVGTSGIMAALAELAAARREM